MSEFLLPLEVGPFDESAAMQYGPIRASLARRGKPIGPLDTLIASQKRTLGLF